MRGIKNIKVKLTLPYEFNTISCFSFFSFSSNEIKVDDGKKKSSIVENDCVQDIKNNTDNHSSPIKPNELFLSRKEISYSASDYIEINISTCVDFYLTSDPLMAFLKYRKEGLNPVLHLISCENNEEAYLKDINYIDFQLRSNFLYLLISESKSIKFPIISNGITYIQYLFFIRNTNLQVLNFPICTPSMLVQLYSNGTDQQNIIEKRNCDLISEAYEISDIFNHDSIIVNLLNFNDSSFIIKTLLIYFETFFKKSYCVVKNLIFITDLNYESFSQLIQHSNIAEAFEKYQLKYRIFSD